MKGLGLDESQIDALVVEYLPLVKKCVGLACADGVPTYIEADDLIQECAIRLPKAIRDFRGDAGASMKTYLTGVIKNDVKDQINRARTAYGLRTGDNVPEMDGASEPEDLESNGYGSSAVWYFSRERAESNEDHRGSSPRPDLRKVLTPEQAEVVELCHLQGLTQEVAAVRLGITRNAVKSRLLKAEANIKKHFPARSFK